MATRVLLTSWLCSPSSPPPLRPDPQGSLIGLYPLSGNAAQVGIDSANAVASRWIINQRKHGPQPALARRGPARARRRKIRVIFVDHQGKPDVGQAEGRAPHHHRRRCTRYSAPTSRA
jgi:hypothetical protein